jgi:hypothetical protein
VNALQNKVLDHFLEKVGNLPDVCFAGLFPDAVHAVGNHFPAVLIEDGDQPEYRMESARRVQYQYQLRFYLYLNTTKNRLATANEITDTLIGTVLDETGFDPAVCGLDVVAVEKGEARNESADFYQPGVYQNITVRRITFALRLRDTR